MSTCIIIDCVECDITLEVQSDRKTVEGIRDLWRGWHAEHHPDAEKPEYYESLGSIFKSGTMGLPA
jgi:hypothetical protein